jgi:hypothetical protein
MGRKGGKKAASSVSPEQRQERAKKAGTARSKGKVSIAAKNEAILAGEKEPWCGLRDGLLQG